MYFELKLALRLLFTKPRGFYRLARLFTIGTIAISVGALLLSLSAFRGYIDLISERYVASSSDIVVANEGGYNYEPNIKEQIKELIGSDFLDAKYFAYLELLVSSQNSIRGLALEAFEPDTFNNVIQLQEYIIDGEKDCIYSAPHNVIVGSATADIMNLKLGSSLDVIYTGTRTEQGRTTLKVCGIMDYGLYDLDSRLAYISLDTAKILFPDASFMSSLKIKLNKGADLEKAVTKLEEGLNINSRVRSWKDINYGLLESVKLDRFVIGFILSVLIAVAIFNIIATLFLLFRELRTEISVLQVLGLSMLRTVRVFFYKGLVLGLMGYSVGLLLWVICVQAIKHWGIVTLPPDIYLVSKIPLQAGFLDLLLVLIVVLFFVFLGSAIPLWGMFLRFKKEGVYYGIKGKHT